MRWEDVVCQGLAVFVIVFCHFSVAWLCHSLESSWLIPSFHFLVFHVYMYWLLSVFSDPGYYYAKSPIMTASKSIDMDIPSVQLQKSKDGKLLVFHDAEFPLDDSKVVGYSFSINPCFKCRHYKPPRCHHCRTCGKCVLRYDHHCPWIGNCIGQGNVSYFNRFLIFTPASLFYAIWLLLRQFYDWKKSQFLGLSELEIGRGATLSGWYIVWMAITFVILIVTAILVSAMAYYHICVYALHNMTTLDNIAMDEDMSLYESQFIYNLGSWPRNWRNVMGNGLGFGIWGWSKCQGDGINHKVNHLAIHVTEKDEKVVNQAFKKDNFQEDAFKKDNFQEDAFKNDDFQEDAFKNDDFQEDAFKKDDFQKDTFKKDDFQKDTFKKDVDDSTDDKLKRR